MTNRLRSQLDESSGAGHLCSWGISFAAQYVFRGATQNRGRSSMAQTHASRGKCSEDVRHRIASVLVTDGALASLKTAHENLQGIGHVPESVRDASKVLARPGDEFEGVDCTAPL
jgi:hypothetical protein